MKTRKHFIFPALYIFSFAALAMKKLQLPFHSFFVIIAFDGMAIAYFLRAFTSEKMDEVPRGRSFNFDIGSIIYALCCIAILYRLEYWDGWEHWVFTTGILFLVISLLMIYSYYNYFKRMKQKENTGKILLTHLSWIYFLVLMPPVALMNPRTFHNLFNGTTYEEYVRTAYSPEEGNALLERYKPGDESAAKCAKEFSESAAKHLTTGDYAEALADYNRSIDLNPDDAMTVYNRGKLKLTKLDIDKTMAQSAYDDFTRAIGLDSNLAAAWYHRGVAYHYLHDKDRLPVRTDLMKARSLDTSLSHDDFIIKFLALPLVDSTVDTTSYVKLDDEE